MPGPVIDTRETVMKKQTWSLSSWNLVYLMRERKVNRKSK